MNRLQTSRKSKNQSPRIFLCLGALVVCGVITANGQDSSASSAHLEIPVGPLLKPAPDFSKWTVSYSYPKAGSPGAAALDGDQTCQVTTTRTGEIISEDIVDGKGHHTELWHVGALQYRKPAGKADWFQSSPANGTNYGNSDYSPLPSNGYRDWEWVGKDSYVGTLVLENGKWFEFVPGSTKKLDQANPGRMKEQLAAQPLVAYVNAETRFPDTLRTGEVTQRFLFASPPTGMQALPPDLVEQIKKGEEARRRLYQPARRPY